MRPNKPPGGHQALPRQAAPKKKSGCAFTPRATGAPPAACRRQHELRPRVAFHRKSGRPVGGDIDTSRRTPSFFLASFCKLRQAFQKHGSIFSPHWPVDFCAPKRLVFVSRPAALGFAACGTCLSPAPALVWLLNYLCLSSFCSPVALVLPVCK